MNTLLIQFGTLNESVIVDKKIPSPVDIIGFIPRDNARVLNFESVIYCEQTDEFLKTLAFAMANKSYDAVLFAERYYIMRAYITKEDNPKYTIFLFSPDGPLFQTETNEFAMTNFNLKFSI